MLPPRSTCQGLVTPYDWVTEPILQARFTGAGFVAYAGKSISEWWPPRSRIRYIGKIINWHELPRSQ